MSIYKDNVTGKWRVVYRYTDWTGKTKQTSKRGFPTKREAQMWEHEQMLKHDAKLDMTFASFYEIYVEDKKERIRDNTWGTKNNIARTKILPYFGERKIAEIEPKDVIAWQNHLLAFKRANGKGYSASYLRKIHSQLSAIFNHAVDFYHLPSNPAQKAGNIAKVSGVKRIRVHDLRHSHVSLLINMGFTVLAIADRMGHESIDITYRYAHLFPSEQTQMAEQLDIERMEKLNGEKSGQ